MFDAENRQPSFETARLVLRPMEIADASLLSRYAGDRAIAQMTRSVPSPMPVSAAVTRISDAQAIDRTEDLWAIDGTPLGLSRLVGVIGLERMDRQQSEISYWVAPEHWNNGIASEAVESIVMANPHQSRTIFASVFQDNPASARVLTNAGFAYLGDAEAECIARNGPVPTWTYLRKQE